MLNIKEVGKPIPDFEKFYEVSNLGRVSNYRKVMRPFINNSGYEVVDLRVNGTRTKKLVHRLVAQAFIPNPNNKCEVNHIDGNKLNNSVDNLEWVTSSENKQHAINSGLKVYNLPSKGKKIGKQSKYHNVTFDKSRNKWVGAVRYNKVNYFQKRFETEIEAAQHVNWILDELSLDDRPRNIFD